MKYVSSSFAALSLILGLAVASPQAQARYDWDSGDGWNDHGHDHDEGPDFNIGSLGIAPDSGFTITVETQNGIAQHSGGTARIKGQVHVNGLKGKRKHQTLEDMLTDRGVALKFFYPDMLHDVSAQVSVDEDDLRFSFTTPPLAAGGLNTFTAVVTSTASNLPKLQRAQTKIDVRIQKFTALLAQLEASHASAHKIKDLKKLIDSLRALSARITAKIANSTKTLAETRFPLQIDNQIAQMGYTSTLMGKFRLEITATPGSAIEGMKAQFLGVVTNLRKPDPDDDEPEHNDSHDKWITQFFWEGDKVKEIGPQMIPNGQSVSYSFTSDALSPGNAGAQNSFGIQLYSVERNHGHDEIDRRFAHLAWDEPVLSDNAPPQWLAGGNIQNSFEKIALPVAATIQDALGVVDQASIKAVLTGMENSGVSVNLNVTDKFSIVSPDQGQTYNLSGEINPLTEGAYVLTFYGSDLAGNDAVPLSSHFRIDRTPPVIAHDAQNDGVTNNPNLNLAVFVTDFSPTHTVVFLNEQEAFDSDAPAFTAGLTLREGANLIQIQSFDGAANSAVPITIAYTLDTTPPILSNIHPNDGTILNNLSISVSGQSNESLSAVTVNGHVAVLAQDQKTFSDNIIAQIEGPFLLHIQANDRAGNFLNKDVHVQIVLRVLNGDLVSVMPDSDNVHLVIVGAPGAARPGVTVNASAGFFNSGSATAATNGSFKIKLLAFTQATVTATDSSLGRTDSTTVTFGATTFLSGTVKDTTGNALSGATVSVSGTSAQAITNASGVFMFAEPLSGDQTLVIDGTTIPSPQPPAPQRKFSKTSVSISIGLAQSNVLQRPIYLAPILLDGTATQIESSVGGVVTSASAPGVELDIPAGETVFPDGQSSGLISITTIPAEFSTIPVTQFAQPNNVIALEPSGLTFRNPVQLTLPNSNELPPGTDVVILSMNSKKGIWEIGGAATVSGDGTTIITKPNMGLLHFSIVFAAPLGPKVSGIGSQDQPGTDTFNGALTTAISLPTYKSLGQKMGASLQYKSSWARPTALVSNLFDIPRQDIVLNRTDNFFGTGYSVSVQTTQHGWIEPDFITAQFFTQNIVGDKVTLGGVPNQSVLSYAVDLKDPETGQYFASGIYPTLSRYEVHLKQMVVATRTVRNWELFGNGPIMAQDSFFETRQLDKVFPSDLGGLAFVQNEKNSPTGSGWRIGGVQKIANPADNRLMIEEAEGSVASYAIANSITTLYDANGSAIDLSRGADLASWPYAYVTDNVYSGYPAVNPSSTTRTSKSVYRIDLDSGAASATAIGDIFSMNGTLASDEHNICYWETMGYNIPSLPNQLLTLPDGTVLGVDEIRSLVFKVTSSDSTALVGAVQATPTASSTGFFSETCGYSGAPVPGIECMTDMSAPANCSGLTPQQCGFVPGEYVHRFAQHSCSFSLESSGLMPRRGFDGDHGFQSALNSPKSLAYGAAANSVAIADTGNSRVRLVDLSAQAIQTVAGNGQTFDSGDGGPATQASLFHPRGVAYDAVGNLFISTENGYIRKVDNTGRISTFAGRPLGQGGVLADTTPAAQVFLSRPYGLAVDNQNGYLYIADSGNHRVVRIDFLTQTAVTVAGNGIAGFNGDNQAALNASLSSPTFVGLDPQNNLLINDAGNNRIRRVIFQNTNGGVVQFSPQNADSSKLVRNADGSWTRTSRSGRQIFFDVAGRQIAALDRTGRQAAYDYDGSGRLISVTDATGRVTQFHYSGSNLSSIVDPVGRTSSFAYSGNNLVAVNFPNGTSRTYGYNAAGLLATETNERGLTSTYTYNQWNRISTITRPDNSTVKVDDSGSSTITNTFVGGNVGTLQSFGKEQVFDGIVDARSTQTKFVKDTNGYITTIVDGTGNTTTVERNSKGSPIRISRPDGTEAIFSYDSSTEDLLTQTDTALNSTVTRSYDAFGNVLTIKNGRGFTSVSEYDPQTGLLLLSQDPLGHQNAFQYGSLGLLTRISDSRGVSGSMTYDSNGNVATITDPSGNTLQYTRDLAGNPIMQQSSPGHVTQFEYDAFNRITAVTNPKGEKTTYTYFPTGDLETVTDPSGNITRFQYDELGRVTKRTDPLGFSYVRTYDGNGNLIQEIDPNQNVKQYSYNSLNQLIQIGLPDNTMTYSYSVRGNLTQIKNQSVEYTLNYDGSGRPSTNTMTGLGAFSGLPNVMLGFQYDQNGNRTLLTDPTGTTSFAWDAADRLIGQTNSLGESYSYGFDASNRLTAMSGPGINTNASFDNAGKINELSYTSGGNTLAKFNYLYDSSGNNNQLTTLLGQRNFGFDANNQLLSATNADLPDTNTYKAESFSYDQRANRTTDQGGSFTYDNKALRLKEDYSKFYFYDNNGNLISTQQKGMTGAVTNYSYTSLNQLKGFQVFLPGSPNPIKEAEYLYDAIGNRIQKKVIDHTAPTDVTKTFTRRYVYDGEHILLEYDENNSLLARYTQSYLHTDDILSASVRQAGVDRKLASAAGSYMFLKDALGTITDIADSSGNYVQHYTYSSFGVLLGIADGTGADITAAPKLATSYAFTGREMDSESGFYYFRARYYDPNTGRFIQTDPDPGQIAFGSANSYNYVYNNPGRHTDPSGRFIGALLAVASLTVTAIVVGNRTNWDLNEITVALCYQMAAMMVTAGIGTVVGGAGALVGMGQTATAIAGAAAGAAVGAYIQGSVFGGGTVGYVTGGISGAIAGYQGARYAYGATLWSMAGAGGDIAANALDTLFKEDLIPKQQLTMASDVALTDGTGSSRWSYTQEFGSCASAATGGMLGCMKTAGVIGIRWRELGAAYGLYCGVSSVASVASCASQNTVFEP